MRATPSDAAVARRRRRERVLVVAVACLVVVLGFAEGWFFRFEPDIPLLGNIVLFALINLNVILLLLLGYLIVRNLVKLGIEKRRRIFGSSLRARLVAVFVGLTLFPTVLLFGLATQFIAASLDSWFSHQLEQALEGAVSVGRDYLAEESRVFAEDARLLSVRIASDPEILAGILHSGVAPAQWRVDGVIAPGGTGRPPVEAWREGGVDPDLRRAVLALAERTATESVQVFSFSGDRTGLAAYLSDPLRAGGPRPVVVRLLPEALTRDIAAATAGYEDYLQLRFLQTPIKTSQIVTLSIVTLLVLFTAVWFGFFIARHITVPIQGLADATRRVAEGDLSVHLASDRQDEIGLLVTSFNTMVGDLRRGREELAGAYEALRESSGELDRRRKAMETILGSVAAGVVSVDAEGLITTMNASAEAMLGLAPGVAVGRHYAEFLEPAHLELVRALTTQYGAGRSPVLERQAQVTIGRRTFTLLVKASVSRDEAGKPQGLVVVLDDLTDLEKAQRMAAWREVARRIAHEIKNPLTPIQLSAQRIRRKYAELAASPEGAALTECTETIVTQVEAMKRLVNEFGNFARLPRANPAPCNLGALVDETLALYRNAAPAVSFTLREEPGFPLLRLDREQFRQVMINLLENAVQALGADGGAVTVTLSRDALLRIARLEVADTGQGVTPEEKTRMFEPYYSTKTKGTGLGLAIVSSIVSDHNGYIRVRDNVPRGAVIVIELPA